MDSATQDLHLQKLQEFVYDEEKIVTSKWLSTTLNINIEDSKQLLEIFINDHKQTKPNNLGVTYVLMGLLEDDALNVTIVKETDLDTKIATFKKLLNKQINSIQTNPDVDLSIVSLVDHLNIHSPRDTPILGSIVSKNCVRRVIKTKKPLPAPPPPVLKGKVSVFTRVPPKSTEKVVTKEKEELKVANGTTNQNQVEKKEVNVKAKTSSGIASFFSKSAAKPSAVASKPITEPEVKETSKSVTKEDRLASLVDSESDTEAPVVSNDKKSKENQKQKPTKKRPRKDNKKSDHNSKRRKRIVENDSDSDDIFGNDEPEESIQEDIIEGSEDEEPVLKSVQQLAPLNKKRKLVDRTYTDDDGYIITTKEWIEEEPSEDANEEENMKENKETVENAIKTEVVKPTKIENNVIPENKAANGKGRGNKGKKNVVNQPTLMNFFKKK